MPSLVSTGNCKLGHDCRRVCSHRRRDETRQFRLVGGVYWALVSLQASVPIEFLNTRLGCQQAYTLNTELSSSKLSSYSPDDHRCLDVVYWNEAGSSLCVEMTR